MSNVVPYRGIHPYRYADKDYFFGRDEIIEELTVNVILYRLIILFGDSGAGKSSVINAGLIPALEKKGFHSERLRVSPAPGNSPFLIERIPAGSTEDTKFLPSIFVDVGSNTPDAYERVPCSVDRFFTAIHQISGKTNLLLIFDQFEELFTLFANQRDSEAPKQLAQEQILNTIFELVINQQLKVKTLIIIREDFLGKLEVLSKRYPKIFDHYVRLSYLDQKNAKKAIVGPFENCNHFPSKLTDDLADTIVRELAVDDGYGQVHSTQLQIVCDQLWQQYANSRAEITNQEFVTAGGVKGIVQGYFTSEVAKLGSSHRAEAILVLSNLITESDTRDIVSKDQLKNVLGWKDEKRLEWFLESLDKLRIINRTQQRDTFYYEIASEYLVGPIKNEKERIQFDRRWRQTRNWWLKRIAGAVLILSIASVFKVYTVWKEAQPWGYVRNSASGTVHPLKGGFASIGRSTEGFANTIDVRIRLVSRIHLLISRKQSDQHSNSWLTTPHRDIVAIDMRSLNGTTINAEFLPYGSFGRLEDDDIITLAGVAPFQFSQIPILQQPPPSGWGILIDGRSKIVHSLSASRHILSLNTQGKLIVGDVETADSFSTIAYVNGGVTMTIKETSQDLWTTMRLGDYTYVRCKVPAGQEFSFFDFRELRRHGLCETLSGRRDLNDITRPVHDLFTVTYTYGNVSFQIVPIQSESDAVASANR